MAPEELGGSESKEIIKNRSLEGPCDRDTTTPSVQTDGQSLHANAQQLYGTKSQGRGGGARMGSYYKEEPGPGAGGAFHKTGGPANGNARL